MLSIFSMFSVFSMFSQITPCSPILDGRMEQLVEPCLVREWGSDCALVLGSEDPCGAVWAQPDYGAEDMGHLCVVYMTSHFYICICICLCISMHGATPAVLYERSQIMRLVKEPTCLLYLTLYEFLFVSVLVYSCLGFNVCCPLTQIIGLMCVLCCDISFRSCMIMNIWQMWSMQFFNEPEHIIESLL